MTYTFKEIRRSSIPMEKRFEKKTASGGAMFDRPAREPAPAPVVRKDETAAVIEPEVALPDIEDVLEAPVAAPKKPVAPKGPKPKFNGAPLT